MTNETLNKRKSELEKLDSTALNELGKVLSVSKCETTEQLINEILDKEFDGAISKQKQRDLLDAVARNPDDYIICSKEHMVNLAKYLKETFERLDFEVKVFCNSVLGDCYDD